MQVRISNVFHVLPEVFWGRLFFDAEYNRGLYRALGFPHYAVEKEQRAEDGSVRRVLRAVPPVNAPDFIRKKLEGKLYYIEDGTYSPQKGSWEFANQTSVAPESTQIRGVIRAEPHAKGMEHVLDLTVRVSAFGFGALVEKIIEKNTRDSYRVTTEYTNEFAARHGLVAACI